MKPCQYCLKRSPLAEGKSPEIVMLFQILSNPNHSMILWHLHLQCQFCLHIRQMKMWNGADSQLLESYAKKLYFWDEIIKNMTTSFDYEVLLRELFHSRTVPVPLLFPFRVFKLKISLLGFFFSSCSLTASSLQYWFCLIQFLISLTHLSFCSKGVTDHR